MLTRCLFALLAIAALVLVVVSPSPLNAEPVSWILMLPTLGVGIMGIGMTVPWGRWMHISGPRPKPSLAFVSKLLGWSGAGGLPYCLASGAWVAAGVCALLPVSALAMWKGRTWAAWPWYAVSVGAAWLSITSAMDIVSDPDSLMKGEVAIIGYVNTTVAVVWILFWGATGFVLMFGVTAWRRSLLARGAAPGSPPSS